MTRNEETKIVKAALKSAGLPVVKVGHGTGTAYGWLHITLELDDSDRPAANRSMDRAIKAAMLVTGRHGDYDGCINVTYKDAGY